MVYVFQNHAVFQWACDVHLLFVMCFSCAMIWFKTLVWESVAFNKRLTGIREKNYRIVPFMLSQLKNFMLVLVS